MTLSDKNLGFKEEVRAAAAVFLVERVAILDSGLLHRSPGLGSLVDVGLVMEGGKGCSTAAVVFD
jgi:hypothetical protein